MSSCPTCTPSAPDSAATEASSSMIRRVALPRTIGTSLFAMSRSVSLGTSFILSCTILTPASTAASQHRSYPTLGLVITR